MRQRTILVCLLLGFFLLLPVVSLSPNEAGLPVGLTITWTASNSVLGATHYRFIVQRLGGLKLIVRDFDIYNTFDWTPLEKGIYKVSVVVRDAGGALHETYKHYQVASLVSGSDPVITPTNHPPAWW